MAEVATFYVNGVTVSQRAYLQALEDRRRVADFYEEQLLKRCEEFLPQGRRRAPGPEEEAPPGL